MAEHVDKARPLLAAITELPIPQAGLLLLRHYTCFYKIIYTSRVTPLMYLGSAMETFDGFVVYFIDPRGSAAYIPFPVGLNTAGVNLILLAFEYLPILNFILSFYSQTAIEFYWSTLKPVKYIFEKK